MSFLTVNNVVKRFDNHLALNDVSLSVPQGSVFGLLGPNGAGKTTLIRIINQITTPDSGEVIFDGQALHARHIEQIGYLPEERGLYKKMKIGEQAVYLARLKGLSRNDATQQLKMWFAKFGIEAWWERKVEELSKGMQQKIQFIVTVLHQPKLLIFDEPFSGFDPINANVLKQEMLNLRNQGATIIFSTHNMESVEELCDNIALINNSKKILDGSVTQIKETYKSNIFEVKFKGFIDKMGVSLSSQYEIIGIQEGQNSSTAHFRLLEDTTTNDLLARLLKVGNIVSFNEIIPSMNEIFIRVVQEENKQRNLNSEQD